MPEEHKPLVSTKPHASIGDVVEPDLRAEAIEKTKAAAAAPAAIVVPAAVAPAPAVGPAAGRHGPGAETAAEKAERLRNLRRQQEKINGRKPARFILVALVGWWVVSVLTDFVVTCVPGGPPCRGTKLLNWVGLAPLPAPGQRDLTDTTYTIIVLVSLCAALWVAKAYVYPNREFGDDLADAEAKLGTPD